MPILIRGETGTGKEQLARHAHAASGRIGAFVPVNCAALPESLIEAELFGYADGAFTGARRGGAIGLVKEADGGTLFLDEIGDMPVALQAVLLRLLDDWTVRPVGGVRAKVDVFLVSATNASLDKAIAEGRFRSDLLYRLNTLEVTLPRLRDRSDFEAIVHHLLGAIDPNCEITPATIAHLAARPWPGNIRELRNMLARFTLANADGFIDEAGVEAMIDQAPLTTPGSLHDIQRARILVVYAETAGNISETARRLGVSRNTIYRALGQKSRDDLQVRCTRRVNVLAVVPARSKQLGTAAQGRPRRWIVVVRLLGDQRLRRQDQAGDGGRIANRAVADLDRIDDAGLDEIDGCAVTCIEAVAILALATFVTSASPFRPALAAM